MSFLSYTSNSKLTSSTVAFSLKLKMAMCWNTVLALLLYLTHVDPSCSGRSLSFSNSLRLTHSTNFRVKMLLQNYKEHMMGDHFKINKGWVLASLPDVNFHYSTWVLIKDAERLCWDAKGLRTFLAHLETQRLRLESEFPMERAGIRHGDRGQIGRGLSKSIDNIQADLENLLNHVNAQLLLLNGTNTGPGSPCGSRTLHDGVTHSASSTATGRRPPRSTWEQREEGYMVLRGLKRFLVRLTRDFTFLKNKQERQTTKLQNDK
ncbi:uncharacterized protein LOC121708799 [Alosa sapidissima]|uniref:uncharacterized protein LOC121708799 n=1 Tax=Alosa sapidissima TaxID=34773 RepID=UPI001C080BF3|nr:uncharacterized protein LOC121708799 [Alosa sapidissima]